MHRYYICTNSCSKVSIIAADAELLVSEAFLERHSNRKVKRREWRDGSDHSAELDQTNRTIESLREDRAMGLFSTPGDEQTYRQQMQALVTKRDELSALPVVRAGWVDVESEQTYAEVWPDATPEARRKLLIDAGVELRITRSRPNIYELYTDLDAPLNRGS
jgi:hypothetical protein